MYMLLIATCSAALMALPTNADRINLLPRFYPVTTDEGSSDITLPQNVIISSIITNVITVSFQV